MISIHVPIAGNDELHKKLALRAYISIHVPIAGNDEWSRAGSIDLDISIHVPIAGNDSKLIQFLIYNCKIFVLYYSYL